MEFYCAKVYGSHLHIQGLRGVSILTAIGSNHRREPGFYQCQSGGICLTLTSSMLVAHDSLLFYLV